MIKRMVLITSIFALCMHAMTVQANDGYMHMEATAYCVGTTRCDGGTVREGIAAGKPEWYGMVAMVYKDDNGQLGEFLGYYEILDTGGKDIKSGRVIDIYMNDYDDCIQFGRKKVIVKLVDGEG